MRKFIVKHFDLGTWVVLGENKFVMLRAARILFPLTVFVGIATTGDPITWDLYWYDYILLGILGFGYYLGFLHFRFFPWTVHELDDEQYYFYLSGIRNGSIRNLYNGKYVLEPFQEQDLYYLTNKIEKEYKESLWMRVRNLIPLAVSILMIVGWFTYWQINLIVS